jgi:hypothetical protein
MGQNGGGKDFVKGQPAGPGRPKLPEEVKLVKRMTHIHIAELAADVIAGNVESLKSIVKDPNSTAIKVAYATCVLKAIQKGDVFSLNAVLDRIVGKVKTEIEVTGPNGGPILMAHMTLDDVRREYDRLLNEEFEARRNAQ